MIPARMAATRFPGKPLVDICGKPMVQWVYERASSAKSVSRVIVATCDAVILDAVKAFGGEAVMTSDAHRSGTDRIAEAAAGFDADVIVNVQGDEPLIDPSAIDRAIEPFVAGPKTLMTSLMVPIDREQAKDPNLVKVVIGLDGHALYFSRSVIPYERNPAAPSGPASAPAHLASPKCASAQRAACYRSNSVYGHVGLYAYTKEFLLRFASMEPTPLEQAESLEQLRVLEYGYRIRMIEIADRPLGVDTEDDLERVRQAISNS